MARSFPGQGEQSTRAGLSPNLTRAQGPYHPDFTRQEAFVESNWMRKTKTSMEVSRNRLQRRGVPDCCTKMEENWCLCEYQEPTTLPEGIVILRGHSSAHDQVCGGQASQLGSTCQHDFMFWTCIQGSGFEKNEWKVLVFVNPGRNTRKHLGPLF